MSLAFPSGFAIIPVHRYFKKIRVWLNSSLPKFKTLGRSHKQIKLLFYFKGATWFFQALGGLALFFFFF